jgi:hypothetical protein
MSEQSSKRRVDSLRAPDTSTCFTNRPSTPQGPNSLELRMHPDTENLPKGQSACVAIDIIGCRPLPRPGAMARRIHFINKHGMSSWYIVIRDGSPSPSNVVEATDRHSWPQTISSSIHQHLLLGWPTEEALPPNIRSLRRRSWTNIMDHPL